MRPLLLVTRPAGLAEETADMARAAGFDAIIAPLLDIEPVPFSLPPGPFDALLFTSPQAPARAGLDALQLAVPVFAVGERTAAAAEAAGHAVVATGSEDMSGIVSTIASRGHRRILHLCGEIRTAIDVPAHLAVVQVPVYEARAVPELGKAAADALRARTVFATLLFSPRTASIFSALVDVAGIDRGRQQIIAISPRAASAAGAGWLGVAVADQPSSAAMLCAASRLWQRRAHDPD